MFIASAVATILAVVPTSFNGHRLWYDAEAPADLKGWEERSLPIGCGHFGASVFGRVTNEWVQVTHNAVMNYGEDSWMSGGLTDALDIRLRTDHQRFSGYARGLDLETATAWVEYTCGGVRYRRDYIASYPSRTLAIHLTASEKGKLAFELEAVAPYLKPFGTLGKDGRLHGRRAEYAGGDDSLSVYQELESYLVRFASELKVVTDGTVARQGGRSLAVTNATEATVYFACDTNYRISPAVFDEPDPQRKLSPADPRPEACRLVRAAAEKGWAALLAEHLADAGALMRRVEVSVGDDSAARVRDAGLPTDRLLSAYGKGAKSAYLEETLFQYGRYLLVSSSRPGTLPANLQGVWGAHEFALWGSGYWHNINVQMNYWPAFPCNLAECFRAYADFNAAFRGATWRAAADYLRDVMGPESVPTRAEAPGLWISGCAMWPYRAPNFARDHSGPGMGGLTTKLFKDWYDFTLDDRALREQIWPAIHGQADFLSRAVVETNGLYLSKFSASPEQYDWNVKDAQGRHPHYHTVGCAFDQQMIWENNHDLLLLADILKTNDAVIARCRRQIDRYDPVQIGASGQIKEFREEKSYGEIGERNHRHISHLVGLFPGTSIGARDSKGIAAAKTTLRLRGDLTTGWAMAHRQLAWARCKEGNRAYDLLKGILTHRTMPNLWNLHPPFQIDGNFGVTAGVAEMLIQSHEGTIEILPALPDAWAKRGFFKGLCARGAYVVDCAWTDGRPVDVSVRSSVNAKDPVVTFRGERLSVTRAGERAWTVGCRSVEGVGLVASAPGAVFDVGAPVVFRAGKGRRLSGSWKLADVWGNPIAQGSCTEAEVLSLGTLPAGYYLLSPDGGAAFVPQRLAVLPTGRPKVRADTPFALDAAVSVCAGRGSYDQPWFGGDSIRLVSELLGRLGVTQVRDRLVWGVCEKERGKVDYSWFGTAARLQSSLGLSICTSYHDAPDWTKTYRKDPPADLFVVRDFARAAARDLPVSAWEFWNEQNIFSRIPVWNFMAALKAGSVGYREGNPDAIVLPGAPTCSLGAPYVNAMFANDLRKYADVMNFHNYDTLPTYRKWANDYRAYLMNVGAADMPYWITENGTNQDGEGLVPSCRKGLMAHSPEQELIQAEFVPKSLLLRELTGVARTYFFMFGTCHERGGKKDWGTLRRDGTVKPVYSTLATLLREVGDMRCRGTYVLGDRNCRALLYEGEDGGQKLVLWHVSALDREKRRMMVPYDGHGFADIAVDLPTGDYRLTDSFGGVSSVAGGRTSVRLSRFPSYLAGLRGLVPTHEAVKTNAGRRCVPSADEDLKVVIRADVDLRDFTIGGALTFAEMNRPRSRLALEIFNLESVEKSGRLEVGNFRLYGVPDEIVLPPQGRVRYEAEVEALASARDVTQLVLSGRFGGRRISRFVMDVHLTSRFLASCSRRPVQWEKVENWRVNSNAREKTVAWDETEKAIRFDYSWPEGMWSGNKWAYPEYVLRLPAESCAKSRFVEFEVKSDQDKAENDFSHNYVMVADRTNFYQNIAFPTPLRTWEKRRVSLTGWTNDRPPKEIMPSDRFVLIRIGGNPEGSRLSLWVRNVVFLDEDGAREEGE